MFLVVSISGSLVSFLSNAAESPKSVPSQLAQTLPRAANYFMSYVLVKALTGSSNALLQPVTLCAQLISGSRDVTPRQKWQRQAKFASIEWARLFPPLTNIAVIGIAFSVIAPLVLPFVSFAFVLYWIVYRYNVLYVYHYDYESGGRFFIAALNQLFTGLYVMEVCLIGHFFVTVDDEGNSKCLPHGITMVGVLALTVAYQIFTNRTFHSLTEFLPVCGDVYGDALTTNQVGHGDRSVLCERSDGGEIDESLVVKRSGESSAPEGSKYGGNRQVADCQPSTTSTRCFSMERHGQNFKKTYKNVDENVDHRMRPYDSALEPIVWIPRDGYGISADEIRGFAEKADSIQVSDDGAWLDDERRMKLNTCPPDQNVPTFPRCSSPLAGRDRREVR
jgi:hypothetical protein